MMCRRASAHHATSCSHNSISITAAAAVLPHHLQRQRRSRRSTLHAVAMWTRPTPDRNEDWVKPSYVPQPNQQPIIQPWRQDEGKPLYAPSGPEFAPAELPEKTKEMPEGPTMPERRPDPIPAGNPKERPPAGEPDERREAPPAKKD